jgi:pimeloyl-ACP methyl ester carboxylesterase
MAPVRPAIPAAPSCREPTDGRTVTTPHPGAVAGRAPLLADHPQVELLDFDLLDPVGAVRPGGLLALHGFGGDKNQLRPVAEASCASGTAALLPTLRAHPGSPTPEWGYSPLDFVADVHRVADALPGPLDLMGYSYGGLVAALSAVTWAGDRVRSLVLVDQSFDAHPDRFVADDTVEGSHLRWNYDFRHLPDLLAALGVPVLVLLARESDSVGPDERAWLRARSGPLLRCVDVPGTHASLLDHPGAIVDAVTDFAVRRDVRAARPVTA